MKYYSIGEFVEKIVILYKDRLLRFGFEIIENLCNKYGTTIEIIDNIDDLDTNNINKTSKVKKLKKKLKKLQRQCSRKYEMNKKGVCCQKTKNIVKIELKIKKLHSKLKNIRLNHIHQTTSKIVKTKPFRVVMEDLKVSNMMKNKHLSKAIAEQGFNIFLNQMKYKCTCGFTCDRDKNAS